MPRNGSGVYTPEIDFTDEASSPPIEIAKLDTQMDDIATALTNSLAADGQTLPSANLAMNGFRHTDVGAATALNQYARVSEVIDQDYVFYVDTGSADAYVITPSPAISAYEEGQRFVFRATNTNTGASTLNVNNIGAFAIQTNDGNALEAGMIVDGGYYEVTYDANSSPDRFVLTSAPSALPSNVALKDEANTFTENLTISNSQPQYSWVESDTGANYRAVVAGEIWRLQRTDGGIATSIAITTDGAGGTTAISVTATNINLNGVDVSDYARTDEGNTFAGTNNFSGTLQYGGEEVGYRGTPSRNVTSSGNTAASDAGGRIRFTSGSGQTFTLDADPADDAVVLLLNTSGNSWTIAASGTLTWSGVGSTGNRTLPDDTMAIASHVGSGNWYIAGSGIT